MYLLLFSKTPAPITSSLLTITNAKVVIPPFTPKYVLLVKPKPATAVGLTAADKSISLHGTAVQAKAKTKFLSTATSDRLLVVINTLGWLMA